MHKKTFLMAAAACALMAWPIGGAMAQANNPSAKDMKGPPNANGYGKNEGIDSSSSMSSNSKKGSDDMPSASNMKGPPNADGYKK